MILFRCEKGRKTGKKFRNKDSGVTQSWQALKFDMWATEHVNVCNDRIHSCILALFPRSHLWFICDGNAICLDNYGLT